jgi:hypothetical protein
MMKARLMATCVSLFLCRGRRMRCPLHRLNLAATLRYLYDYKLRPLQKSLLNPKVILINQPIVEQAPSPAKYSRGRLFYMIFAEASTRYKQTGMLPWV